MNERKQTQITPEEAARESAASASAKPARGRRLFAAAAVLLALLVAAVGFLAGWFGRNAATDPRLRELSWLLSVLEEQHYRAVDTDAVFEDIYDAVMPDRFSRYYTPEEYARRVAESEGRNEGIGVTLVSDGGHIRLYNVTENSPAQHAGLARGMYVLGYGTGTDVTVPQTSAEVTDFAKAHERFVLYASHSPDAAADEETAYPLTRAAYSAAYVVYRDGESSFAFRGEPAVLTETDEPLAGLDGDTAYIRLSSFDGNCAEEFAACLSVMKERGRSNLILDLRGNGGGYLSDLQSISAHLLREAEGNGPLVAYAQFRDGTRRDYAADGNDFAEYFAQDSRVYVLADENSASASECLIGALIDYKTIGYEDVFLRKAAGAEHFSTYGKGVMQSTYVSPAGSAFQLTVARIYWPSGNCIHDRGVTDADGAQGIEAPLLPDAQDAFLAEAVARICS